MTAPTHPSSTDADIMSLLEAGRLQEALATADEALCGATAANRPLLLCLRANALVTLGQPLQALRVASEARDLALPLAQPLLIAEANLALAFALQTLEEHDRAIQLAAECESIARSEGDEELLARAIRTLAISDSVLGRHEPAIEGLRRAIALLERSARTPARVFHARYSLITAQSRIASTGAEPETAKRALYQALFRDWNQFVADVEARQLLRLRAMALGNAGIAARLAGDFPAALPALTKAREQQLALGLRGHAAVTESHLGLVYRSLGRLGDARVALTQAIGWLDGGSPRELASVWEELSLVHEEAGDFHAALKALREARAIEHRLRDEAAHATAARLEQRAEIARLAESWSRLASEDALTGLANRRAFEQTLAALDAGEATTAYSIILLDLDHFKTVNDRFGHATGDAVLRTVAAVLRDQQRSGDLIARIGGEELAIVLRGATAADAAAVAQRLLHGISTHDWSAVHVGLAVTASAGVAASVDVPVTSRAAGAPDGKGTAERVLALADQRLYAAKSAGRNRLCGPELPSVRAEPLRYAGRSMPP
ncbi:MAG: GGDEF domain-containing protein [Burkholderiales bacterium]|nr:GGDEF domain-containing protein [Burkholderiales bacterium]